MINNEKGAIGMMSLLTVLFVGLKLTGFITWSWWLVCLPTIIEVGIAIVILIGWFIIEVRKPRSRFFK